MIEETAKIVAIEEGETWVETERQSSCSSCSVNKGCGTATLSKVLGKRRNRVRVINKLGAEPGETVLIGIAEQALVKGSLAMYMVPLLGLLLGAMFGDFMAARLETVSEWPAVVGALAGLLLGFVWLRRFAEVARHDPRYQPVVLKRLGNGVPVLPLHFHK